MGDRERSREIVSRSWGGRGARVGQSTLTLLRHASRHMKSSSVPLAPSPYPLPASHMKSSSVPLAPSPYPLPARHMKSSSAYFDALGWRALPRQPVELQQSGLQGCNAVGSCKRLLRPRLVRRTFGGCTHQVLAYTRLVACARLAWAWGWASPSRSRSRSPSPSPSPAPLPSPSPSPGARL